MQAMEATAADTDVASALQELAATADAGSVGSARSLMSGESDFDDGDDNDEQPTAPLRHTWRAAARHGTPAAAAPAVTAGHRTLRGVKKPKSKAPAYSMQRSKPEKPKDWNPAEDEEAGDEHGATVELLAYLVKAVAADADAHVKSGTPRERPVVRDSDRYVNIRSQAALHIHTYSQPPLSPPICTSDDDEATASGAGATTAASAAAGSSSAGVGAGAGAGAGTGAGTGSGAAGSVVDRLETEGRQQAAVLASQPNLQFLALLQRHLLRRLSTCSTWQEPVVERFVSYANSVLLAAIATLKLATAAIGATGDAAGDAAAKVRQCVEDSFVGLLLPTLLVALHHYGSEPGLSHLTQTLAEPLDELEKATTAFTAGLPPPADNMSAPGTGEPRDASVRVVESSHPYAVDSSERTLVHVPGATALCVEFDERCVTTQTDRLQLFDALGRPVSNELGGYTRGSRGNGWPNGWLVVPGDTAVFTFRSGSMGAAWYVNTTHCCNVLLFEGAHKYLCWCVPGDTSVL